MTSRLSHCLIGFSESLYHWNLLFSNVKHYVSVSKKIYFLNLTLKKKATILVESDGVQSESNPVLTFTYTYLCTYGHAKAIISVIYKLLNNAKKDTI